jgi:peroxiredoxin
VFREGHFTIPADASATVALDGTTVMPDIRIFPIPMIRGIVRNQSGQPVDGAVVRARFPGLYGNREYSISDRDGSFSIRIDQLPYDAEHKKKVAAVFIVAFDPHGTDGGVTKVDLTDSRLAENVSLTMQPKPESWLLNAVDDVVDLDESIAAPLRAKYVGGTHGNAVPDLSQGIWLNTDAKSLKDFRGEYVLLDFWFIGCGPCHEDMPSVRRAHELFGEHGFSVVSVHINNMSAESVRQFAKKHEMTYPIVIDRDGSIKEEYRALGMYFYPGYMLIGPDGKIVRNDALAESGSLRGYKIEQIHLHLRQLQAKSVDSLK